VVREPIAAMGCRRMRVVRGYSTMETAQRWGQTSVAIAVLTYRRPQVLETLLPELERQARAQEPPARVIVIDNDPEASARETVHALGLAGTSYVHEPRPGIGAARNTAIRAAHDCRTLVFIDDDEIPDPDWLAALLRAHRHLGGAAISGPVLRTHEREPAAWIAAARVFERRRHPTGTPLEAAGTGNLLVDLEHIRRHQLAFDEELGLVGGSDHLFTKQIRRSGAAIYWCDEATVTEFVPAGRLTGSWTLRRGYRSGSTEVRVALILSTSTYGRAWIRARSITAGLARLGLGASRVLAGTLTRDPDRLGRGAWTAARGAGFVGASLGHRYVEYRRH
jgi:succinoglycan biosynthesis protein ExoM